MNKILLEAIKLKKTYSSKWFINNSKVIAVNDVSLILHEGETLGIVGESGSGKTTLCKLLVRLEKPDSGCLKYDNQNITNLPEKKIKNLRKKVQMIFQNSIDSINPKHTIGYIIEEPMEIQTRLSEENRSNKTQELLLTVGLDPGIYNRYPHELSGGQKQRVTIARALSLDPQVLICDEPVTSLDVSTRAQILNLLLDLQQKYKLSMIFVSHDLDVVYHVSDTIAVMFSGKIVEKAPATELFFHAKHPYTKLLLSALLELKTCHTLESNNRIKQDYNLSENKNGCIFYEYCAIRKQRCIQECPEFREISSEHFCACHYC